MTDERTNCYLFAANLVPEVVSCDNCRFAPNCDIKIKLDLRGSEVEILTDQIANLRALHDAERQTVSSNQIDLPAAASPDPKDLFCVTCRDTKLVLGISRENVHEWHCPKCEPLHKPWPELGSIIRGMRLGYRYSLKHDAFIRIRVQDDIWLAVDVEPSLRPVPNPRGRVTPTGYQCWWEDDNPEMLLDMVLPLRHVRSPTQGITFVVDNRGQMIDSEMRV